MALQIINGMTVVAPWQLGGTASISLPLPDGTERQIHFIKSSPSAENRPDKELFHVCEWDNIALRYRPPMEAPPTGCVVAPIFGSNRGDSGWRLPGDKHGFVWPRIRQHSPDNRVFQVLYSTRLPGESPFVLVLMNLPIPVPPVADFSSVARTLQTELAGLRQTQARLEQKLTEFERLLGSANEADVVSRLTTLEGRVQAAGEAMGGEG